jgi:hypothetical protein
VSDLAYIVKPGDDNEELRYSLRSVHRNMPHERVWIFGHRPPWVSPAVRHVFVAQQDPARWKRQNAMALLRAMTDRADLDKFVLFNDDFFVTEMTGPEPPPRHRGSLAEFALGRWHIAPGGHYAGVMMRTVALLREAGLGDGLTYETHTPMTMTREQLELTLAYIDRHSAGEMVAPRSILGNLHRLGGELIGNVKIYGPEPASPDAAPFLSTTDCSFRYHEIGKRLRRAFPDPSPYEL